MKTEDRVMDVFLEEAAILTGIRRGRVWLMRCHHPAQGAPMSVEADWRWALRREERSGDVLGFYHTHPPRRAHPPASATCARCVPGALPLANRCSA